MKARFPTFTVVAVPFPFVDQSQSKRRPAVVLSSSAAFNSLIGHSVMAMITSSKNSAWPLDVLIHDLKEAGLPSSSVVRMKLFTLDHRIVGSKLGTLTQRDSFAVGTALKKLLGESLPS